MIIKLKYIQNSYEFILKPYEKFKTEKFTLFLNEIVEKWLPPDRRPMMRITFDFKTKQKQETLQITSDEREIQYKNFKITYLEGWRKDAKFRVDILKD